MARLHEYQGKAILAANGFKIPRGRIVGAEAEEDFAGVVNVHVVVPKKRLAARQARAENALQ
ncbi:MAG: hypothetical protein E6L07_08550 [Verrucomicrobia bacterium]|nr:MAG: hypothetical protein E6L07_08550 [Verrucomicrobiota bacterium]